MTLSSWLARLRRRAECGFFGSTETADIALALIEVAEVARGARFEPCGPACRGECGYEAKQARLDDAFSRLQALAEREATLSEEPKLGRPH